MPKEYVKAVIVSEKIRAKTGTIEPTTASDNQHTFHARPDSKKTLSWKGKGAGNNSQTPEYNDCAVNWKIKAANRRENGTKKFSTRFGAKMFPLDNYPRNKYKNQEKFYTESKRTIWQEEQVRSHAEWEQPLNAQVFAGKRV